MKSVSCPFLIAIIVCGFALAGAIHIGMAQASTEVGGIINSDTTWTLENSPYIITATVQIPESVTLTIDPGVTVTHNSTDDIMFTVHGRVIAHGTASNNIVFIGGGAHATFFSTGGATSDPSVSLDYCTIRHGYAAWWGTRGHINLTNSEISDMALSIFGSFGGYSQIYNPTHDIYIEYNTFIDTNGFTIDHHTGANIYIRYNLFKGNRGFIVYDHVSGGLSQTVIKYNSFIEMNETVLRIYSWGDQATMDATENYWGTSNTSLIDSMIYDGNDDINIRGFIEYLPILTEPHPDTPTPPEPTSEPEPEPEPEPTPKLTSQLSISVDASSTVVGSAVNINGKLTDVNGSALHDKSITLSYSITGNEWVPIGSGTTNDAGEYNIQWVNTASGTFTLKVEWIGNDDYLGASANTTLSFLPQQNQKIFFVESNSTVSALTFNSTNSELRFTVSGSSGTTGYVKATIPKELLSAEGDWVVLVDEHPVIPTVNEDANNTYLYFTYGHSTKTVKIIGTYAIPEFPSWMPLLIMLVVVLGVAVIYRRNLTKPNEGRKDQRIPRYH